MSEKEREEKLDHDAKFVNDLFPEYELDVIKSYLIDNSYDVDALTFFMQQYQDEDADMDETDS